MLFQTTVAGKFVFDTERPIDISIRLIFDGDQPNAFGVETARARPCEAGALVGDTRRGGSCNFEQITLIPHCNGTHTECVGHITNERISVIDCIKDVMVPALLASVAPEALEAGEAPEAYPFSLTSEDRLITRSVLERKIGDNHDAKALIVRTLPNDDSKLTRRYGDEIPPFFSTEAMEFIVECGFEHLLVDLPSIDRTVDGGQLSNHRIFWNVAPGSFETNPDSRINSTITELIYVPDSVPDGEYLLNLQIAPFASDASPSRPVLFKRIG
ncbi:MAG: cyclase family protein [Pyrinomonadaceae bacterium]